MPVEVILPKVDMDMETATIERWVVGDGEVVKQGQLIFEIGTSKAVMEVEAPASGTIRDISARAGETVRVGTAVAWIYAENEAYEGPVRVEHDTIIRQPTDDTTPVVARDSTPPQGAGIRATPLARRLARQNGLDLAAILGTGPRGRVCEADILAVLAAHGASASPAPGCAAPVAAGALIPFGNVRKLVAERLTASAAGIPHFYLQAAIDMSRVLAFLEHAGPAIERRVGVRPSLTVFLVHALGRVLANHPALNASVEGEAMRVHPARHIGIAMDRDGDLVVPVLRHAGAGSLGDTAAAFDTLRRAVVERRLKPSDMEGGTFTLSNLGMFGVDAFTAIINPPQSAILAVGRVSETPVGVDGEVVLRPVANFCLSSDHRIVDGVTAARFMSDLRETIETPELLL